MYGILLANAYSLKHRLISTSQPHSLVERLKVKRQLLAVSDPSHADIKTALVIAGGGMRGAYAAGIMDGLSQLGYDEVFDSVIGISAGAGAAAYFVAKQTATGSKMFEQDLSNKQFIRPLRRNGAMDLRYLEYVLNKVKPLDQAGIRRSRSNLYIAVTETATGKGTYLEVRAKPELDIIKAILASCALPGLTNGPITIDGVQYSDGITGCTTPIDFAINQLGATDILVINNAPLTTKTSLPMSQRLLTRLTLRRFSQEFQEAHLTIPRRTDFHENKPYTDEVTIGVLCPEKVLVGYTTRNKQLLAQVTHVARLQVIAALTSGQ